MKQKKHWSKNPVSIVLFIIGAIIFGALAGVVAKELVEQNGDSNSQTQEPVAERDLLTTQGDALRDEGSYTEAIVVYKKALTQAVEKGDTEKQAALEYEISAAEMEVERLKQLEVAPEAEESLYTTEVIDDAIFMTPSKP